MDNRLKTVLPNLIDHSQTGFLKNRRICCNTRKTLDIIEFTKKENIPGVILSLNMEKCFDKIDYMAIYGALRYYNSGENFIKWVSLFYNRFEVCTQNFGFQSEFFVKGRSINQGCIISPGIFLLTSEILASKLINNSNIKGIKIGHIEYLLSQFSDDIDMYLAYDLTTLNAVIDTLVDIELHTGLTVSYEKTTLYRIGSIANSNASYIPKKGCGGQIIPSTLLASISSKTKMN